VDHHLDIPQDGSIGPHVSAHDSVTAVEYKTDLDYRISFVGGGWKNFLQTEHLHTGQAILIVARRCRSRHMQLMFVIEIINDLASSGSISESE
jgi:uncharacterized protein YoaH (UPF0181 family)